MLNFQSLQVDVPNADTPLLTQMVQMDISRSFFVRNVGVNQVRLKFQESADGTTYSAISGLDKTLDPGAATLVVVESSYPFVRMVGNGNSRIEVGAVGSFRTPPVNGLALLSLA